MILPGNEILPRTGFDLNLQYKDINQGRKWATMANGSGQYEKLWSYPIHFHHSSGTRIQDVNPGVKVRFESGCTGQPSRNDGPPCRRSWIISKLNSVTSPSVFSVIVWIKWRLSWIVLLFMAQICSGDIIPLSITCKQFARPLAKILNSIVKVLKLFIPSPFCLF